MPNEIATIPVADVPVCPVCKEPMVRAHFEIDGGVWLPVWLCNCPVSYTKETNNEQT